jgi:hypothetical protein
MHCRLQDNLIAFQKHKDLKQAQDAGYRAR